MGFMDYQAPQQVNWNGAVNNLIGLSQAVDQKEMNDLKKQQIKRENDKEDKSNALAEQYTSEKDESKKGDIFKQMVAIDPKRAESMYNTFSKMDEKQYIDTQRQAEQLGKVAFGVIQDPTMLDKMFPTLPKTSQDQLLKMGYDPTTPMDANKAKLVQGIGQHFINMAQDTKTLADHAFRKEEAKTQREFTSSENALNRANQKDIANIQGENSIRAHQISADATRYNTDQNVQLYKEGLKGFGSDNKANAIEVQAYKSAVSTLGNPLSSPQEKAQAQATINALQGKYRVNGSEGGMEQQGNDPLGIRKR